MTAPKIATINRGGSRFYVHPDDASLKYPGVTSITGMLPKPFLGPWQAKMAAETAVEDISTVIGLMTNGSPQGRQAAIDHIKGAARRYTKDAATRGDAGHKIFEQMAEGITPRVHPEYQGFVDNFGEFLDAYDPRFLHTEETVWSDTFEYAGSFDAIVEIGGELVILDYKTGKSVYPEVGLQLSGYRYADHIIKPDGSTVPIPAIEGGAVLSIHAEPGDWKLIPVRCDEVVFSYFTHLREILNWDRDVSKTILGRALPKKGV